MPCLPIAHGFGRIGCYLTGCCYGIPYNGILSVNYTCSLYVPHNLSLFPVQLLEACLNFILAIILITALLKKGCSIYYFYIYLISYASFRFLLEFLRYDYLERGVSFCLSPSQIISLIIIIAILAWLIFKKYFNVRRKNFD